MEPVKDMAQPRNSASLSFKSSTLLHGKLRNDEVTVLIAIKYTRCFI